MVQTKKKWGGGMKKKVKWNTKCLPPQEKTNNNSLLCVGQLLRHMGNALACGWCIQWHSIWTAKQNWFFLSQKYQLQTTPWLDVELCFHFLLSAGIFVCLDPVKFFHVLSFYFLKLETIISEEIINWYFVLY